ncbi:hypothetical protein Tco_1392231 [Tanacetum coccineum]
MSGTPCTLLHLLICLALMKLFDCAIFGMTSLRCAYEVKVGIESVSKPKRHATLFIGGFQGLCTTISTLAIKALVEERTCVLTFSNPTSASVIEGHTSEGVGLRVTDSHIGNHREDDFTSLETIRRFLGVFGSRSLLISGGEAFEADQREFSNMSAKNVLRTQTCTLTKAELMKFLVDYDIPSEFKVMLPKSNQTMYDAPEEYFHVHLSRLDRFGCAKLTTFAVMCKAYDDEPSVDLFKGFFNLYPGGDWLTFAKRPEADVPTILLKPITRIKDWKEMAFKNFMFAADDEVISFLPHELSPGFGGGSPSSFINNDPPLLEVEPLAIANPDQLVENTADSEGSHFVKGEHEVINKMEKAREPECEAAMEDIDKNPAMIVLRQKIVSLLDEVKEHHGSLDRMLLESQNLEGGTLCCYEEVSKMKEPFKLAKVKGYRQSYKKEYTQARNDLATAVFPFLYEATTDPSAPIELLLSKKPQTLCRPTLSNTLAPTPSAASSKTSAPP